MEAIMNALVSGTGAAKFEVLGAGFTALFFSSSFLRLPQVTDLTIAGSPCIAWPAWSKGDQLIWVSMNKAGRDQTTRGA